VAGDIDIVVGAQDKASAVINAVAGKVGGMSGSIGKFINPLTASLAGAAAGLFTVAKAIQGVSAAAGEIDAVNKAARGMGESAADLQAFQFAMGEIGGLDAGKATAALQKTTEAVGKALAGDTAKTNIFEKLQLDAEKLSAQGPVAQFEAIRSALSGIENVSERAAAAQQIFGKSAKDLLPVLMSNTAEFDASMKAAEDLGLTVSAAGAQGVEAMNDAIGRASAGFSGVANAVAVQVAPLVETIATTLAGWVPPILEIANQWLPTIVDSAAAIVGFATDFYNTMYKVATLDFSGAFETATNALGEQGTAAQLILKVQEARNRAAEVAAANEARAADLKAATLAIDEDGLKTEEAKVSEGEKLIAQLERKLAIAQLGADVVERQEQLATATNDAERERIANLQKQLDLQEQSNELAKERAREEEKAAAERQRLGEQIARDAEDRERQIATFRPGGDVVESRLLTRGSAESSGDKLVKLTEKTLEVLRQLLTTTQGQDPAASSGGVTLEYMG
jgi:hypothetical protein